MTLAQLLLNAVLLAKRGRVAVSRVSEDATRLIDNTDLVSILKLSSLVTADDCIVDEGSIRRKVFEDSYRVASFVLWEEEAVAIGDGGEVENAIWHNCVLARPFRNHFRCSELVAM